MGKPYVNFFFFFYLQSSCFNLQVLRFQACSSVPNTSIIYVNLSSLAAQCLSSSVLFANTIPSLLSKRLMAPVFL